MKNIWKPAFGILILFTLICGVIYPLAVTGIGQLCFNGQANGSLIKVNDQVYGSSLLGQYNHDDKYLWNRIQKENVAVATDDQGQPVLYGKAANTPVESQTMANLVNERAKALYNHESKVPAQLVSASASGLDPEISKEAAMYQAKRIASARHMPVQQVESIISACSQKPWLGIFDQDMVNVLKANLMLDGILKGNNS